MLRILARIIGPHWVVPTVLVAGACQTPTASPADNALNALSCSIPAAFIGDGGPGKDGIPALTNPSLVAPDHPGADYLRPFDRVIGLEIDGEAIAVPLNIGWWHEVINFSSGPLSLAITHCPLTGSSLVFDRSAVDGAEFGVSGLLYMNNLMMYDRTSPSSLWPQMSRGARCGRRDGVQLPMYPSVEMRWDGWQALHPDTRVVSSATGHARNYRSYPYGDYATLSNTALLAPVPLLDSRRPPKERVLGIVAPDGASLALPFGALSATGVRAAVSVQVGPMPAVVFWEASSESAAAFVPTLGSQPLTFRVIDGAIVDDQTGSSWTVDGRAVTGPLTASRLTPVRDNFVAYWFAWAVFYPETDLWSTP